MKRVLTIIITLGLLGTSLVAKQNNGKKSDISKVKAAKIEKLEAKKEIIEKRISCIKDAKTRKEIKECEKKYPLVKRTKKMKKTKKQNRKKTQSPKAK
ncbi:hypothetical protein NitYY0826_C0969 [Nitratiruptor sp. YY08-26]|uniref:hypothetical protein n=1 Tax=unclassified Nitratiruptor TaxID=2624044 RepID=UPI0019151ABF|nr:MULTISPECIES: hypothetical protein [unclassified Nitratiruptor]BCD62100.1 hypothetical protein NitYY0813_C0967 [Nitratiruptor sp. YY08-13]BCD66036.1 hypothetical protein NitYY0826_C0969 [Nitratiruptor sp. YY08-26]